MFSVRSVRWTAITFALGTVGIGMLVSASIGAHWRDQSAQSRATFDPTNMSLSGLAFGELAMGVLGILVISGEYAGGSIRSTLAAVPDRLLVLAAKAAVLGGVGMVVGEGVTFATFLAGQAVMGPAPHASLTDPGVVRAVALSGAFLGLIGLFGLGVGAVIRHSAGAIAALAGIVLLVPPLLFAHPGHVVRFAPEAILASSVGTVHGQAGQLSPWMGMAVMASYAALALGPGGILLARRDA